ncbi:hypothetical protein [Microbacterium sp. NPDC086615]|uniref:hypothetical protein n=1 Tax=Microbacterium sp. NPDC086615 TaxID=3154865 RepID=UPI00343E1541
MSNVERWNEAFGAGSSLSRQARRDLDQIAVEYAVKAAREQARAAYTMLTIDLTISMVERTQERLKATPQAAPFVMPLLEGYARSASYRSYFGL